MLLFCLLYPPSSLVDDPARLKHEKVRVYDRTALVPGYCDEEDDVKLAILSAIDAGQSPGSNDASSCLVDV